MKKRIGAALVEDVGEEIEQDQLKGFARSVAEVEWLLLILVLLFLLAPGTFVSDRQQIVAAMVVFGIFIIAFRYLNFYRRQTRLKIAIETLVMIAFTTAVLEPSGGHDSPLLNLYLLPIIVAALTLGKWTTLLFVGLVTVCYFYVGADPAAMFSLGWFSQLLAKITPFLLVAFITTMLANDIHIAKSRIQALSETDELTGLYNMRAFARLHRREHNKAERYGRPYAILVIDMDNLKQVNDGFGHEAGNKAIVLMANVITRLIRNTDVAARYGGDEFIVLLSEADFTHAEKVGQRIRNSIQNTSLDVEGRMIRASASVGVAAYPRDGTDMRDIAVKADHDMYKAKELRRAPTAER